MSLTRGFFVYLSICYGHSFRLRLMLALPCLFLFYLYAIIDASYLTFVSFLDSRMNELMNGDSINQSINQSIESMKTAQAVAGPFERPEARHPGAAGAGRVAAALEEHRRGRRRRGGAAGPTAERGQAARVGAGGGALRFADGSGGHGGGLFVVQVRRGPLAQPRLPSQRPCQRRPPAATLLVLLLLIFFVVLLWHSNRNDRGRR